ncbi:TPA: hypothetical protein VDA67_001444 [Burkholderia vietnamiensis]|nr:hypothetical protein [Burkholderia vietnamiensis]HEP6283123.1 hypothetical protein [Burkholderia vietnamiensis]HEP6308464.1 hypothetical protein [Burkholderia vietnamiensis]
MTAASDMQRTDDRTASGEQFPGGQRTVAPTRTRARLRAATSRDAAQRKERPDGQGPVATSGGHDTGEPLWEDDRPAMPPEEWS